MTFLELEKKCKKRRLLRSIKVLFLLLIILNISYFSYEFFFKNKEIKKINYIEKEEIKEKNVSTHKEVISSKKEVPTLKLFLDFNITSDKNEIKKVTKDEKMIKKNIKTKKELNKEQVTKPFIKTTTLPPFDKCILLANKYYKEGNYKEALKWAKNANIQNNKKAISWILSAKSLHKMGKKEEAIKLLKLYYNYNKDEKVKKLMEQLSE